MINGTMVDKSGNFRVGGPDQPNASCSSIGALVANSASFGSLTLGGILWPAWQPHTPYQVGSYVLDPSYRVQQCIFAGTSGPGPVWKDGLGQTTVDGSVTWTCISNAVGATFYVNGNGDIDIANSFTLTSNLNCNGGLIVYGDSQLGAPPYLTWSAAMPVQAFQQLTVGVGLTQTIWLCLIAGTTGGTESFAGGQGSQVVDGTVTWINIGPPVATPVSTNVCLAATYASSKLGVTSPGLTVAFNFTDHTGAAFSCAFVQGIMTYLSLKGSIISVPFPTPPSGPGNTGGNSGGYSNQLANVTAQISQTNWVWTPFNTSVTISCQVSGGFNIPGPIQFVLVGIPDDVVCTNATGSYSGNEGPVVVAQGTIYYLTFAGPLTTASSPQWQNETFNILFTFSGNTNNFLHAGRVGLFIYSGNW